MLGLQLIALGTFLMGIITIWSFHSARQELIEHPELKLSPAGASARQKTVFYICAVSRHLTLIWGITTIVCGLMIIWGIIK